MRQVHGAGEKGFVDYAGKAPCLTDPATGERIPVEVFVMALGASSYTYAAATATRQLPEPPSPNRDRWGQLCRTLRAAASRPRARGDDHRPLIFV